MAGILGMDPLPYTFRQFFIMFEARQLHDWDQTHLLSTHLTNIPIHINNMFGKRRQKFSTFLGNHHLRQAKPQGMILTPKNLHVLKGLVGAKLPQATRTPSYT